MTAWIQKDRITLILGSVIGFGIGILFMIASTWCLLFIYWPNGTDWWKYWEVSTGFLSWNSINIGLELDDEDT